MWSSSFADLAKKAQELQEQASSISTGEFFNLDAMQSITGKTHGKQKAQQSPHLMPNQPETLKKSPLLLPVLGESSVPVVAPKAQIPPAQKGKLKMAKMKSPKLGAVKLSTDHVSELSLSINQVEPAKDGERKVSSDRVEDSSQDVHEAPTPESHNKDAVQSGNPKMSKEIEAKPPFNRDEVLAPPVCDSRAVATMNEAHEAPPAENGIHIDMIVVPPDYDPPRSSVSPMDASESKSRIDSVVKKGEQVQGTKMDGEEHANAGNSNSFSEPRTGHHATEISTESSATKFLPWPVRSPPSRVRPDAENVMQQFIGQLQRLEANFEAERRQLQREHSLSLEKAEAAKEEEMKEVREMLKAKDLKVRELKRIKEGNELRMDSLKREVEGTKELLQRRDNDIEQTKETSKKEKEQLEQKVRAMELAQGRTKAELKLLKAELQNSRGQLGETNDEYTNLKSRVKTVAGELKDRRAECRVLRSKIQELEVRNSKLEDQIWTLDAQLSDRDRSGTEKEEEANRMHAEIVQLQLKAKEGEKRLQAQELEYDKCLSSYKKKAQNSLAVANARAAAAIQAKEEAELEVRVARSIVDSSQQRARIAEAKGQKSMEEAKEYYKELEQKKNGALKELEVSKTELEGEKKRLADLKITSQLIVLEKERLGAEIAKQGREIEVERSKASRLQYELEEAQRYASTLQGDIVGLRCQLQQAESAAATNANKSLTATGNDLQVRTAGPVSSADNTSKATIIMLQKRLSEANQMIEELKDALENAGEMNGRPADNSACRVAPETSEAKKINCGDAPLFYAMEKQAELNTARNEINRLASLYADVQSEKVEAEDALKYVRRQLNEERAKLQRYEKLGSLCEPTSRGGSLSGGITSNGHEFAIMDPGRTNIEYLKNIMMSFLNAKTLGEKKALVPVIGAVLCLTPDEHAKALQSLGSTGGIEGFSTAFFETLGSRVNR